MRKTVTRVTQLLERRLLDSRDVRHAYIDIVDACNLRCFGCPRGTEAIKSTTDVMPLDLYKKICAKLKSEGNRWVALFNWAEPFLHSQIPEFVEATVAKRMKCVISSNLSLPKISTLSACFEAGLNQLIVSVSGFSNDIQTIYHKNSNINLIKENLETIAKTPEYAKKTVISFLRFDFNQDSIEPFRRYAANLGMYFANVKASNCPESEREEKKYYMSIPPKKAPLLNPDDNKWYFSINPQKTGNADHKMCGYAEALTMDCHGKLYLCCDRLLSDEFCIGNYMDLSKGEILLRKYLHPECRNCSSHALKKLGKWQKWQMRKSLF